METEENSKAALAQVDVLADAEAGTAEFDRLDVLVMPAEAYEASHYPRGDHT